MLYKIERMKQKARDELPKARLCAHVVCSLALDADEDSVAATIRKMKTRLGVGWSVTSAFQFMSGRQAVLG